MLARIRSIWLAGGGAVALTLTLSGVVAAATILTAFVAPAPVTPTVVVDTSTTFEDLDGNGIDDDCQTDVVADPVAAASAETAADLDGDGTISVTEAAQSGRVGGKNCNHGGYVSAVAQGDCAAPTTADSSTAPEADASSDVASGEPVDANDDADTACADDTASAEPAEDVAPADCPAAVEPAVEPSIAVALDPAPNAHGKTVSDVAKSDAVGGKNCNHGGAVSEAAKKDQAAAKDARAAAKAARDAAREARRSAHAAKHHGKPAG
jgi:hypothetical protein